MLVVVWISLFSGLLSLLSWVGWRFFIASAPIPETIGVPEFANQPVARTSCSKWIEWLRRSRRPIVLISAVILVGGTVVGGVFVFSNWIVPDPLSALEMERQGHIQTALNPERLVPPPALPPSLFLGSERPALDSADRDWAKLNPDFTQSVLKLLARLQERGFPFALLEGYRSPERQEMLANLGNQVTNARAFQSRHQYGLAVDLAPLHDGRLVISELDPWAVQAYAALGEEAERGGLVWGGRWSFKDYGHVEASGSLPVQGRSPQ